MQGEGLSNADFRSIMMTPRRQEPGDMPAPPRRAQINLKSKTPKRSSKKKENVEEEISLPSGYRDRAKERREGKNVDYETNEAELLSSLEPKETEETKEDIQYYDNLLEQSIADSNNKTVEDDDQPHFSTLTGRAVYHYLFTKTIPKRVDNFLPGRTAFVFNLDENSIASDIPTILKRSKDDCPTPTPSRFFSLDQSILEQVGSIMHCVRNNIPRKVSQHPNNTTKSKGISTGSDVSSAITTKDVTTSSVTPQSSIMDDSDDDIFPDIGSDYVPTVKPKAEVPNASESTPITAKFSYFGSNEPEIPKQKDVVTKATTTSQQARMDSNIKSDSIQKEEEEDGDDLSNVVTQEIEKARAAKRKLREEREKNDDSYAECFPGTYESTFEVYDGSDEEDISKMDQGGKNKLRRSDFLSEEAWEAYNSKREQLPKAAFQYGVKAEGGRKTKKGKKNQDRKIDSEMKKINRILLRKEEIRSANVPTAQELRKKSDH